MQLTLSADIAQPAMLPKEPLTTPETLLTTLPATDFIFFRIPPRPTFLNAFEILAFFVGAVYTLDHNDDAATEKRKGLNRVPKLGGLDLSRRALRGRIEHVAQVQ
jgi:hypothetical protein